MNRNLTIRQFCQPVLLCGLMLWLAGCATPPPSPPQPTVLYQAATGTLNASYDEGVAQGKWMQARHDAARIAAAKAACAASTATTSPLAAPQAASTPAIAPAAATPPPAAPAPAPAPDLPLPPVTNSFNSQGPAQPLSYSPF